MTHQVTSKQEYKKIFQFNDNGEERKTLQEASPRKMGEFDPLAGKDRMMEGLESDSSKFSSDKQGDFDPERHVRENANPKQQVNLDDDSSQDDSEEEKIARPSDKDKYLELDDQVDHIQIEEKEN